MCPEKPLALRVLKKYSPETKKTSGLKISFTPLGSLHQVFVCKRIFQNANTALRRRKSLFLAQIEGLGVGEKKMPGFRARFGVV